jgi:hypothetical protein
MAYYNGHKIGTGESGHSGNGKSMSGKGNWGGGVAKQNPGGAVVGHTPSGKGKGYNTDAHSGNYHGPNAEAVGSVNDHKPMKWDSPLHMEGKGLLPHNGEGAKSSRAMHHSAPSREGHRFAGQRGSALRMSGNKNAHRIGCK